jgi:hypothetical protein
MKRFSKTIYILLMFTINGYSQTPLWKTDKNADGKIIVKSFVSERRDQKGETVPLIEYIASTTGTMTLPNCIKIMKDVSVHKAFLNTKSNEKVKAISDNEWYNYYVFSAPWPFSPSDCIVKVDFEEDLKAKTALFTFTATPTVLKLTSMNRFTFYNFTYAFKDIGKGNVEIIVSAKMTPPVSVPLWMLRASFPGSATDPLEKLVTLIKDKK